MNHTFKNFQGWRDFGKPGLLVIGAIVALGAALRIALYNYSLYFDELASLFFADHKFGVLWSSWIVRETNPPLYYSLLRLWISGFGVHLLSLRMLSVIAGIFGMLALIYSNLRWYGPRAATAAAVLICLAPHHIFYSLEVRAYIFGFDSILVSLVGIDMLVRDANNRLIGFLAYVLGATLAIYFHTTLFLWPIVATLSAILVYWREVRSRRFRTIYLLIAANLLIALFSAWWLFITLRQLQVSKGDIDWIKPLSIGDYRGLLTASILFVPHATGWLRISPYIIGLLTIAGAVINWKNPATRLLTAMTVFGVAVFGMASLIHPIIDSATIFWMTIFPLHLAAAAIGAIRRDLFRRAALGAIAALLILNLVASRPGFVIDTWSDALNAVAHTPGGVLVVAGQPMGIVAGYACRVEFPEASPCPIPIIATSNASDHYDVWARGLYGRPLVPLAALGRALPPAARVFLFSRPHYEIVGALRSAGYLTDIPVGRGQFVGPIRPDQLPGFVPKPS